MQGIASRQHHVLSSLELPSLPSSADFTDLTFTDDWPLILTCLAGAVVLSGQPTTWRVLRVVVTIAHEAGHALAAVLVRRELAGIRLHSDTSGVTLSRGRPDGPGMVFTAFAGYPAPSLLGVVFATLVGLGEVRAMLWGAVAALAVLLTQIRNAFGLVAVVGTGGAAVAVMLRGSADVQLGFAAGLTWLLLVGGLRAVIELQRSRSRQGRGRRHGQLGSDADQLARLTPLPALGWVSLFFLLSTVALLGGGWLMLR